MAISFSVAIRVQAASWTPLSGEDYLNSLPTSVAPFIPTIKGYSDGTMPMPSAAEMRDPQTQQLLDMTAQYDPSFKSASYSARAAAQNGAPIGQNVQQVLNSQSNLSGSQTLASNQQPTPPVQSANFQGTMPDGQAYQIVPPNKMPQTGGLSDAQMQNALNPAPAMQIGGPNLPKLQAAPSDWILPNPAGSDNAGGGILGQTVGDTLTGGILGNGPALSFGGLLGDANAQSGNGGYANNSGGGLIGGGMFAANQPADQWAQVSAKIGPTYAGAGTPPSNGSPNSQVAPNSALSSSSNSNRASTGSTVAIPITPPKTFNIESSEGGDVSALSNEVQSLDPRLWNQLKKLYWVAVPDSIDQDEAAGFNPNEIPRGYPKTNDDSQLTYGDLDGVFDPNAKPPRIIIATSGNNAGDSSYNTVFHETGHGIDNLGVEHPTPQERGKLMSDLPTFLAAYDADKSQMTPGEDDYYLNPQSGRSEAFAESFARYFGGDSTLRRDWPNMYNYWATMYPNVHVGAPWKWSN